MVEKWEGGWTVNYRGLGKTSVKTFSSLIPISHNPRRKCRSSPSAVARTLKYLVEVLSWAASSRREEKQVRINFQKAREYLEGGNEVIPKLSPLQGMKAQPLQSLFAGEVMHTSNQPCS